MSDIGVREGNDGKKDERVEQVISNFISGEWLNYSVRKLADAVFLSESRLTHLFKEEVGISLKSYILIRKMERAYRFVSSGEKITHAAQKGGFASSAHLAYTCKTLTGVSITEVLKSVKKADF
ncbi:MAG: helix-turn-helix transcriptional regulator [Lachnospiraceae bacterium]